MVVARGFESGHPGPLIETHIMLLARRRRPHRLPACGRSGRLGWGRLAGGAAWRRRRTPIPAFHAGQAAGSHVMRLLQTCNGSNPSTCEETSQRYAGSTACDMSCQVDVAVMLPLLISNRIAEPPANLLSDSRSGWKW